jgi:hypothetical protein
MSGYRDNVEALRAQAEALERELADLKSAKERDEAKIAELEQKLADKSREITAAKEPPPAPTPLVEKAPKLNEKPKYKRSWKNLLLDKGYQTKFALVMVISCAIFMTGLGFFVFRQVDTATATAITNVKGASLDKPEEVRAIHNLVLRKHLIDGGLVLVSIALSLGLGAFGIKMTHKVAGPLFKIGSYCDKVSAGKFDKLWNLRKGDQLVELYESFKLAHETLRKAQEKDVAALKELLAAAERDGLAAKSPDLASALGELRMLLERKEASLV